MSRRLVLSLGRLLVGGALAVTVASVATAEPNDYQARSAARQLGAEGLELYDAGRFEEALDKFERANQLLPAPTLSVRAARCLVKLDRWIEASERYLEVTRMTLPKFAPAVHRQAVADAAREREALLPRIPHLVVRVRGHAERVIVNGRELPDALLGQKRPSDPGTYEVEAIRGDVRVTETVTLTEAGVEEVSLTLPEPPPPEPPPPPRSDTWDIVQWTALGFGVGGLVAGATHGLVALAEESRLESACPNRTCPPDEWGGADLYDALRVGATAGFILAAVGLSTGVAAWIAAPPDDETAGGPTLRAHAGLRGVWVTGTF